MAQWVRLCGVNEAPKPGEVTEVEANGTAICLANIGGELRAMDNLCPHRQGPLGQGWIEGEAVICPWHAWAFNTRTGVAEEPEQASVRVFPVSEQEGAVLADLS